MAFFRRLAHRLWGEAFTRAGRRRFRRRVASRLLVVFVAIAWTYPFTFAFSYGQLVDFVAGRVVVSGDDSLPVLRTVVALVPAPPDPAAPRALDPYVRVDDGAYGLDPATPANLELGLWTSVDGRFATTHVAPGLLYRVEVRRPGCPVEDFGVRSFAAFDFFGRRLTLEVPPCLVAC